MATVELPGIPRARAVRVIVCRSNMSRGFIVKLKERMKELRMERNLSQKKIAADLGIGITTYCRYELGEREPGASLLDQMADYYDVTTDYLLGRSNERR